MPPEIGQGRESSAPEARSLWSRPAFAGAYALAVAIAAFAAIRATLSAHADREYSRTGAARWIWYSRDVREPRELSFVATRDVVLDRRPARATAKVFGDRWHVLWVNGRRAGGARQRPGDPLALYEVAPYLSAGVNRIAIEAGSDTGIGGLLFSLDIADSGRDAVVSDGRWRVDPDRNAITSGGRYRPAVWGAPPMYPWGWPRLPRPDERPRG
ncbi:MAG TPA: hypothetical protein VIY96_09580 [Thermoanaerobaculia bacterium]